MNTSPQSRASPLAPVFKPISQAAFWLSGTDAFARAIQECAQWMRARNPQIPLGASDGSPFRVSGGSLFPAEAVLIEEADGRKLWAASLEDNRELATHARTWVTEITVGSRQGVTAYGARLVQIQRGPEHAYQPSRPGCVHQVISRLNSHVDGQTLSEDVRDIQTGDDYDNLKRLLQLEGRRLPVLAISRTTDGSTMIDPIALARRVSGLAHIVEISSEIGWALTNDFGKSNSLFDGAIRLYRQNFDPVGGNPFDHPLWINRGGTAANRAARLAQIVYQITSASVRDLKTSDDFSRYDDVRNYAAAVSIQKAKDSANNEDEIISLLEAENARLQDAIRTSRREHDDELQYASDEIKRIEAERDESLSANNHLRARVASLEAALRERGELTQTTQLTNANDIEDWCNKNLAGSIWVAPKAIRETEKHFSLTNQTVFGETLLMLRDFCPDDAPRTSRHSRTL